MSSSVNPGERQQCVRWITCLAVSWRQRCAIMPQVAAIPLLFRVGIHVGRWLERERNVAERVKGRLHDPSTPGYGVLPPGTDDQASQTHAGTQTHTQQNKVRMGARGEVKSKVKPDPSSSSLMLISRAAGPRATAPHRSVAQKRTPKRTQAQKAESQDWCVWGSRTGAFDRSGLGAASSCF